MASMCAHSSRKQQLYIHVCIVYIHICIYVYSCVCGVLAEYRCVRLRVASCASYVCVIVCLMDSERRGNSWCAIDQQQAKQQRLCTNQRTEMLANARHTYHRMPIILSSGDKLRVRHRLRARAHPRSSLLAVGVGRVRYLSPPLRQFSEV